jgi:hypothetical protein
VSALPRSPFRGSAAPIPADLQARMRGCSWHPDPRCPPFAALALLTVDHHDLDGVRQTGQMVVAAELADELLAAFEQLWAADFPIERMEPIDAYGGDDDASMAANNSSAFNFRTIAGSDTLSQHSYGVAIDLNPRLNPMITRTGIYPPSGAAWLDRDDLRPGMITRPGVVVDIFDRLGWEWGGDWTHVSDFHHFAKRR